MEITFTNGELHLAFLDFDELPPTLSEKYAASAKLLDLTGNHLSDLEFLAQFPVLETLIIDSNSVSCASGIGMCPTLQTLCINKNEVSDLSIFLDRVRLNLPGLRYLSMLGNPANPNGMAQSSDQRYMAYRYFVINKLQNLMFLDSSRVTAEEKKKAAHFVDDANRLQEPTNPQARAKPSLPTISSSAIPTSGSMKEAPLSPRTKGDQRLAHQSLSSIIPPTQPANNAARRVSAPPPRTVVSLRASSSPSLIPQSNAPGSVPSAKDKETAQAPTDAAKISPASSPNTSTSTTAASTHIHTPRERTNTPSAVATRPVHISSQGKSVPVVQRETPVVPHRPAPGLEGPRLGSSPVRMLDGLRHCLVNSDAV